MKGAFMDIETYRKYILNFEINLLDCRYLGRGHNGVLFQLPDGKVIKICFEKESCLKEYYILSRIGDNKYFPKVYGLMGNYMIRDYVDGVCLSDFIKKNGLSRQLSVKLMDMLIEFKALGFKKLDLRCRDIYVGPDSSLKVIDPKKFYSMERNFPRHLSKGLYKLGVLEDFLEYAKVERPLLYSQWRGELFSYINNTLEVR
jgi:RIO-like serine/threonine protein kinase